MHQRRVRVPHPKRQGRGCARALPWPRERRWTGSAHATDPIVDGRQKPPSSVHPGVSILALSMVPFRGAFMDIQRLYSTVAFMLDEDRRLAIQQTLEQLSNFLVNLQNQPGNQQLQGQAVQFRDQLTQGMRQFQERVTPVQRARIIDLSQDYFSLTFSESIEYEMQRNAMAPAVIAAKVKDLSTKRKELLNRLDSLRSTMDYFH